MVYDQLIYLIYFIFLSDLIGIQSSQQGCSIHSPSKSVSCFLLTKIFEYPKKPLKEA